MPITTQSDTLKQASSVADQFKNAFSSSVKETASTIDGVLKSAPSSVSDALSNVNKLAGKLGSLGMGAASSVKSALNQLGGLGPYTKFPDTFVPPSKIKDISPEDASRAKIRYLGGLTYPENLGEYFISFTFKRYDRKVPLGQPKDLPVLTINLPIPTSLQEQFGMQYSDKQLGVAGYIEEKLPKMSDAQALNDRLKTAGEQLGNDATSPEGIYYGVRTVAGLSDSVGGAIDKATGAILNPFQALVFQGVNLRSHSFSYKFSPNSRNENNILKEIIYEFKRRMHPQKDNLLFQFPDIVDITFGKQEGEPYFFTTCFLESMSVNYAPSGTPAFFSETSNPVEIELTLNFKEIKPVTREDIKKPKSPYVGPNGGTIGLY